MKLFQMRSSAMAVAILLVAGAVLAGCGGKKEAPADDPDTSQSIEDGTQLDAVSPLTGLPIKGKVSNRPVMAVKIDNSAASRPQVGTGTADMIVEQLVEGGITRLAVLFYSKIPETAGPVRSARATDIGIIKPTDGVLVASGAAPPTYDRLNNAGITYYIENGPGYYRNTARRAPYNLFVRMNDLAAALKKNPTVPPAYLPWGTEEDFVGVRPATRISAQFSRATTTVFAYDAKDGTYDNVNTYAAEGDRFRPDSVLVLRVRQGDAGYVDPGGNRVPETLFFGKGKMMLFHNGEMVRGTWFKSDRSAPLELQTAGGDVVVPAGKVWIELVPNDDAGGSVTVE